MDRDPAIRAAYSRLPKDTPEPEQGDGEPTEFDYRRKLAWIEDHAVYSDSLGVPGSGFNVCRWCGGGSSPGKGDFRHNADCIFEDGKLEAESKAFFKEAAEAVRKFDAMEDRAEKVEAELAAAQERILELENVIKEFKIRVAYIGMPQEPMQAKWPFTPDWSKQIQLADAALRNADTKGKS